MALLETLLGDHRSCLDQIHQWRLTENTPQGFPFPPLLLPLSEPLGAHVAPTSVQFSLLSSTSAHQYPHTAPQIYFSKMLSMPYL